MSDYMVPRQNIWLHVWRLTLNTHPDYMYEDSPWIPTPDYMYEGSPWIATPDYMYEGSPWIPTPDYMLKAHVRVHSDIQTSIYVSG